MCLGFLKNGPQVIALALASEHHGQSFHIFFFFRDERRGGGPQKMAPLTRAITWLCVG